MDNEIRPFFNKDSPQIVIKFILDNNDSITISGNSVSHVFFETVRRYPENFPCKFVGFVTETKEQSERYLKEFLALSKKYSKI